MSEEEAGLPCCDKISFESYTQAKVTATVVRYRYGNVLRPYRCHYCGLWHLTGSYPISN